MSCINFDEIPEKIMPLIVLTDCTSGFVEWTIKWRTKGNYNHVMWAHRSGFFASQGNTYSEAPYSRYTRPCGRIKLVEVLFETEFQRNFVLESINTKLKKSWFKKRYDWLGIFGAAIGVKWLNVPWLEYCSEDVIQHLKALAKQLSDGPMKTTFEGIPKHASPEGLNAYMKRFPEVFRVYGRWDSDEVEF